MMQEVTLKEFEDAAGETNGNGGADELTKSKSGDSDQDREEPKADVQPKADAPETDPKANTPADAPSKAEDPSVADHHQQEKSSIMEASFFQIESLLGLDKKLSNIGKDSFDSSSFVDASVREPSVSEPADSDNNPKSSLDPPGFNVKKLQKPMQPGAQPNFGQRLMSSGSGFLASFGVSEKEEAVQMEEEKKEETEHFLIQSHKKNQTPNHVSFAPNTREPCDDTASFTATITMDSAYDSQYKSTFLPVVAACLDDGFLLIEDGCKMVDRATSTCAGDSNASLVDTGVDGKVTNNSASQERGFLSAPWMTRDDHMLAPCMTLSFARAREENSGDDTIVDDESKITLDEAISRDTDVNPKHRMRSASAKYTDGSTLDPSVQETPYQGESPSFEWFFSSFDLGSADNEPARQYYMPETSPPRELTMPTIDEEMPTPRVPRPDPPSSKSRKIKSKSSSKKESKKEYSAENPPIDAELFGQMSEQDQQAAIDMARKLAERADHLKMTRKKKKSQREAPVVRG